MNFILYSFRRYHQLTKEDVANKLRLDIEEYNLLESGLHPVIPEVAQIFSSFYKAPKHLFLIGQADRTIQVFFNNNHFENSNAFVNTQNIDSSQLLEQMHFVKDDIIASLKEK